MTRHRLDRRALHPDPRRSQRDPRDFHHGLLVHLQVVHQWRMAGNIESQLYSLVLAENGIEYARTLLPHLELNSLLRGIDDRHCGTNFPEWRNPVPFTEAPGIDPKRWAPLCDDGLPFYEGQLLLPNGYPAEGGGNFFLRFSNNPEESPDQDEDHVILVRSVGIVPSPLKDPFLPGIENGVALVEARFRQEVTFFLPSPLTVFGDSGSFQWEGTQFSIAGNDHFGVSIVSVSQTDLYPNFLDSLSTIQQTCIQGRGLDPSIHDATALYLEKAIYQPLFQPQFWSHFVQQLPDFEDGPSGGILFYPEGGVKEDSFSGVLVVRKNFTLSKHARIEGLLLHLGNGRLVLQDATQIVGAVWMSNLDSSRGVLTSSPLSLLMSGTTQISYDVSAVRKALAFFPPTQLGWRILFPEMMR